MADLLDPTGLSLSTLSEIVSSLETGMKAIYGSDINIDPDTPDGQMINLFAQAAIDLREVIQDIYNSFDPDQAQGVVLDQRVALNGVVRNAGTFTVIPVDITVDRSVNLVGLDTESTTINIPSGVFTVKDNAGTQFVLLDSVTITTGLHALSFRAVDLGAVNVTVGTITTAVTAIAGVTLINNSSGVTTQGVDEETDAELRTRRIRSIANSATGYLDAIQGNLQAVDGVTAAVVYENTTSATDVNGIPPHSIWAIINGGSDADIADMIYRMKSAGAGMYGTTTVNVTRPNGTLYPVSFGRAVDADLYVSFSLILPDGIIDTDSIKTAIVQNIIWQLGEDAIGSVISAFVQSINPKHRITNMLLSSDDITFTETVTVPGLDNRFVMSTARITIS